MKITVIIATCLMICLSACSRKVNYTTTLAQKSLNKTGTTKRGKTLKKWYYSDLIRDLNLVLFEPDTSSIEVIRRGVIKETITSSGDKFTVLKNTVGGAFGTETLGEINIKFDKETDRTVPFSPGPDGNYYLKTIDVPTQANILVGGGYVTEWNGYYWQQRYVYPHYELQNIIRYFVKIKAPDNTEKIYEADTKIMLYIKHWFARKIERTSKVASGYKPK